MMRQQQSNSAQEVYEKRTRQVEGKKEASVARNEKKRPGENLQEFEDTIGDGCLYAQSAGTSVMMMSW